jgi:FHS family glucose/mannose:H+ symporter-like MFS transporter
MLGPLIPTLEARWHMGDSRAGLLFSAQAVASVVAALFAGKIARRFGFAAMVTPGLFIMAAAVACIAAAPSWSVAMLGAGGIGAGLGLVIPAGNLGTAQLGGHDSARQVMILNLVWCAGALGLPLGIRYAGNQFIYGVAAGIACAAALALLMPNATPTHTETATAPASRSIRRTVMLTSMLVFLYVGVENAVSGWISSLGQRNGEAGTLWTVLPAAFWIAMFTGRAASPRLLRSMTLAQLTTLGLGVALAGSVLLIAGHQHAVLIVAGLLCGLGLAPIFPAVITQFAEMGARSALSGVVFASANLGGGVMPFAIGALSTQSGSLRWSMALLLPVFALLFLIQHRLKQSE